MSTFPFPNTALALCTHTHSHLKGPEQQPKMGDPKGHLQAMGLGWKRRTCRARRWLQHMPMWFLQGQMLLISTLGYGVYSWHGKKELWCFQHLFALSRILNPKWKNIGRKLIFFKILWIYSANMCYFNISLYWCERWHKWWEKCSEKVMIEYILIRKMFSVNCDFYYHVSQKQNLTEMITLNNKTDEYKNTDPIQFPPTNSVKRSFLTKLLSWGILLL